MRQGAMPEGATVTPRLHPNPHYAFAGGECGLLSLREIWLSKPISRDFNRAAFAMNDPLLPLPGLSSVSGKPVVVKF